jgi:tetratricopeptide (TPR) repeat protein
MPAIVTVAAIGLAMLAVLATAETERQRLLKLINENPGVSDHYVDLANTLASEESVQLLPKSLNRAEAYLLAIQIDPKNAVAFNNLGVTIANLEDTVTLGDGVSKMNKQELFLKAIESDPKFGHAYNNLAETMQPDQKMNYPDGRQVTRREMFVKSIELDPEYPYAYNNLGVILADAAEGEDNTVTLANGETLGARASFLRCIALGEHPALHHCYRNIAQLMDDSEIVVVPGQKGDRFNKEQALQRAGDARKSAGYTDEDDDM